MAVRVMLVDDSAIVRGLLTRALEGDPDIEVAGSASNGVMAIATLERFQPDVVILDIEMPEMDGLTALPKLLEQKPGLVVIMASTLTERNAEISLQALKLGAMDYLPKPNARDKDALESFYRELKDKIRTLGRRKAPTAPVASPAAAAVAPTAASTAPLRVAKELVHPVRALAIASSTGGPQALMMVFEGLKDGLKHIPIFITQHMPATFTSILAEHLSRIAGRPCTEGKEGEVVQPGHVYVAPGDYHMIVQQQGPQAVIRLNQEPPVNFCRPAADPMLESLSSIYGDGLLATVLTGMGQDGLNGCRKVVEKGGAVIAQNEATCVVWGMPRAVTEAQLCTAVLPLEEISSYLVRHVR